MMDHDTAADDSTIPGIYTFFGQFVDHRCHVGFVSTFLPSLLSPDLAPLSLDTVRATVKMAAPGP